MYESMTPQERAEARRRLEADIEDAKKVLQNARSHFERLCGGEPMTPERLARILALYPSPAVVTELADEADRLTQLAVNKDEANSEIYAANLDLRAEVDRLKSERSRYVDAEVHWAVRLSKGTHLDFYYDEAEARRKAAMYRATLLCCDVLSTEWREVGGDTEPGEPDLSNEPIGWIDA